MEDEQRYYARRAEEHRRYATMAVSEAARLRHLEMAERLASRALRPSWPVRAA